MEEHAERLHHDGQAISPQLSRLLAMMSDLYALREERVEQLLQREWTSLAPPASD